MIHPTVQKLFDEESAGLKLFLWICENSKNIEEIDEFIVWHLNANKRVIDEILKIKRIDFEDSAALKEWSDGFLEDYDRNIRELRETSNKIFDRFQHLKRNNFDRLKNSHPERKTEIEQMMNSFLSHNGLLIGRIIFTYREPWFLANQISNPDFKLGTIKEFSRWEEANFENILRLQKVLEDIHFEIKKEQRSRAKS